MPVDPALSASPAPSATALIYSEPSALATVSVPFTQWWLVVPERPDMNMPLTRLASGTAPSNKTVGVASFPTTQVLEEGIYHPFSGPGDRVKQNAIITHGAIQGEELDLSFLLRGDAAHDAFVNVMNSGYTCLLQSDQTKQWYVDMGGARSSIVLSTSDRKGNPLWIATVHVIEQDAP